MLERNDQPMEKKGVFFGRNKEIFDAELCAIMNALEIAIEETSNTINTSITIFSDLQKLSKKSRGAFHKNRFFRR